MLNLKIDKNLKIIYSVWIFVVLGSLVLLYSLPFVLGAEGDPLGSWSLTNGNDYPEGITTDGNYIWVIDWYDKVYKYSMDGEPRGSWNLLNIYPAGIATDGNHIWVIHNAISGLDTVYKYSMGGGDPLESWSLDGDNLNPSEMTTDGINIWVVDGDLQIYKYYMNGSYIGPWAMGDIFSGIATDGNHNIWFVDRLTKDVYKMLDMSGYLLGSWSLGYGNDAPRGITTDGNSFWVVDYDDEKVYKYELLPPSTCTCPGPGNNWVIDMADHCTITLDCDLGTGTLSFTGSGDVNCDATIDTANLGDPGASGILYIQDECIIKVKRACDVDKDGHRAEGICGGDDCNDNDGHVYFGSLWTADTSSIDVNCDGETTIVKWVYQSQTEVWVSNPSTETITTTPCSGRTSADCEDSYYASSLPTACGASVEVEGCYLEPECQSGGNEGTYYIRCR